ncbi:phosphonate metabolism protein [Meridianimarinicoccus roseus]|uniref:Phosphonate metabolism protein n=1 Tax=Meridianimarinicoccus roseus TaxID=2072018 RepID=A0A2V2LHP3_9RHOB|nr:DUF1045 domain-containing protein [Meridianimarinicoccus roseus]PWR04452.1 phosphonate metabolism protein [Meridianimarinicoccus roseus]
MGFARYAVYFTPEGTGWGDFCAAWLGWDSAAGRTLSHPEVPGLPAPAAELTERPRKYGFHATLKPPFRLANGTDAGGLARATQRLAADLAPVTLDGLALDRIGGFLALVPRGDTADLSDVAARVVENLDAFRAPLSDAELARRRAGGRLSPRQQTLLDRWGYPYTHDAFRFHMTLTGPLARADADTARAALAPVLGPLLPRPFRMDALTLLGADDADRFHRIARYPLAG